MSYSVKFECIEHPWNACVIIFDDGQTKLNRHLLSPDRPVLVHLEGLRPSAEQIEMARHLWARLYEEMDFRVAAFARPSCPTAARYGVHRNSPGRLGRDFRHQPKMDLGLQPLGAVQIERDVEPAVAFNQHVALR